LSRWWLPRRTRSLKLVRTRTRGWQCPRMRLGSPSTTERKVGLPRSPCNSCKRTGEPSCSPSVGVVVHTAPAHACEDGAGKEGRGRRRAGCARPALHVDNIEHVHEQSGLELVVLSVSAVNDGDALICGRAEAETGGTRMSEGRVGRPPGPGVLLCLNSCCGANCPLCPDFRRAGGTGQEGQSSRTTCADVRPRVQGCLGDCGPHA